MIKKHARRLPVVEDGKIQGIVYISDLFYNLLDRFVAWEIPPCPNRTKTPSAALRWARPCAAKRCACSGRFSSGTGKGSPCGVISKPDLALAYQLNDSQATILVALDLLMPRVRIALPQTTIRDVIVGHINDCLPFPKNVLFPLAKKDLVRTVAPGERLHLFTDLASEAGWEEIEDRSDKERRYETS